MSTAGERLDEAWLNDRSEYQQNFVHGLNNPAGLHVQYRLERDASPADAVPVPHLVVGDWTPDAAHMGFPGVGHGGLVAAILDDVMGRCPALLHRWVVTARMEVRYRGPAAVGVPLRVEAWMTTCRRRVVVVRSRALEPDGSLVAEAEGTYLPVTGELRDRMVAHWPGFEQYLEGD